MKLVIKIFLWLALPTLMFACHDNDDSGNIRSAAIQTVTFSLNVSKNSQEGSSRPESRALTVDNENTLKTVTILAFVDEKETGKFTFAYRCPGRNITSESGKTTFLVDLKQYHEKQIFVILANAEQEIASANITEGTLLNEALPKFTAVCSDEWPAKNNGSDAFRSIPMYGKTGETVITSSTKAISSITLIRMLARIDVRIKSSVTNFQLAEACVFNRKDRGFVAYEEGNWNSEKRIVTAAKVPDNAQTTKLNSILYKANDKHEIIRGIYTFESKGVTDRKEATAIIIGGYYDYPRNQELVTYYRVDIPKYDESKNQIIGSMGDILRNFLYDIEIQEVSDSGYRTPEEAFEGGGARVKADIVPWELTSMDEAADGESYGLRVSRAAYSYTINGVTNELLAISTDYEKGWEATFSPLSARSWITWHSDTPINEKGELSGATGTTSFHFDIASNKLQESRHAFMKIKVGKLTKYIDFYQTTLLSNVMDWVKDENVDFGENGDPAFDGPYRLGVSRTVYDMPKNAVILDLLVSTDFPKGWTSSIIYDSGSDWITVTPDKTNNGSETVKIDLKENNSYEDRSALLVIKAGNLKKSIRIIQSSISSVNETTNIGAWDNGWKDEGGLGGNSDMDGPYKLDVSQAVYTLPKNAQSDLSLTISTDNPKGWSAAIEPASATWAEITDNKTVTTGGKTTLKFKVESNNSYGDRFANIVITCGKLKKQVPINQNSFDQADISNVLKPWENDPDWDKSTLFDGYYFLSVGKAIFVLSKNAQQNIPLKISTDNTEKWKASVTKGNEWLTISDDGCAKSTTSNSIITGVLTFSVSENSTHAIRTGGEITIQTGRLKKIIQIRQEIYAQNVQNGGIFDWETGKVNGVIGGGDNKYSLQIGQTQYKCDGNATTQRTITAKGTGGGNWYATIIPCTAGEDVSWVKLNTASGAADGTNRNVTFTLNAYPENAENKERKAYLVVRLENQRKQITLTQYPGAAISFSGKETSYKRDEALHSFKVTAKAPWKAVVSEDANKIIRQLRTPSGVANANGEDFYFTLNPQAGTGELNAKIKFQSINGEFDPYEVTIQTTD